MHTVALVPHRGRLYSFGLGGDGQLGCGNLADRLGPSTVKGEHLHTHTRASQIVELCT